MTFLRFFNRVKGILLHPRAEWETIAAENTPHYKVLVAYYMPLALIPAAVSFASGWMEGELLHANLLKNAFYYIVGLGGIYCDAFVINLFAKRFDSIKNFNRAFALSAHVVTARCVFYLLFIIPFPTWFQVLFSLSLMVYCCGVQFIGLQPMMNTPKEKRLPYLITTQLVNIAIAVLIAIILVVLFIMAFHSIKGELQTIIENTHAP